MQLLIAVQENREMGESPIPVSYTHLGPHPYPTMVRNFQRIIGDEARQQILDAEHKFPDYVLAPVGGGSNSIGIFYPFVDDKDVKLIGVEGAGKGIETGEHAAAMSKKQKRCV